uniref:Transient receptor potential cation channel subfamily C member 2b n=1 Tax=Sinocyclocheilus anshuiensis TaxID=1608454 RepID=A0A671NEJ1_9TELE
LLEAIHGAIQHGLFAFAPGVTPLTLACQKDLYDIVTMLSQKGHEIHWPHKISCTCLECRNGQQYDLLKFSLSRINTYRGIASRAYLSITVEDAVLSAFRLSRDLRKLSKKEPEFKPQYLALEQLCQEFAVELLGMCRNQSEVTTILNSLGDQDEDSEDELDQQAFEEGIPNLARLRLAVNYNQKQFVAQPICQQGLSSIWCGNLSGWRGSRTAWKLLVSFGIFLTMPILCLIYWIAPKSKLGKTRRIPVIKFLLHSASYMWFLITLLGESIAMEVYRDSFASHEQTILHNSFHMVWVVFSDSGVKEIWIEGLRSYRYWSNCLDVMVLSMYLASFALRVVIMLKVHFLCQLPDKQEECVYFTETLRDEWHQEDPQFIAEVLFAVTSMLSFTRLAYILPAHDSLGTLQISIGKMIDDMMRYLAVSCIGTAFLCGVNNIYVPYMISPNLGRYFMFYPFGKSCRNVINVILIPVCVGNRITELSKVIGQLHTEMKHIQTNLFDHSDNPKGDPSGGSSFRGKYILRRKTVPLHEPILHEEPAEETVEEEDKETADVQESPTADAEPDRKSNEEQNSEGETDNAVEDMNETEGDVQTGNDDVIEMSMEGEEEENPDTENTTDLNEAETEENGEVEESDGSTDYINEDVNENAGEGIKIDLNRTSLVSVLAKRKNFTFIGNQASSQTGSDDSQDTGFGSQECDLSTSSP